MRQNTQKKLSLYQMRYNIYAHNRHKYFVSLRLHNAKTMEQKDLIKEYKEREAKWLDKSLAQLTFFNNLLLTLSLGFLAFSYKNSCIDKLFLDLKSPNWKFTFIVFSFILISISIFKGLFVAINRLYDFKVTRHINQIRHRMIEHSNIKLDETSPSKFDYLRKFILPFQVMIDIPIITMEECKNYNNSTEQKRKEIKYRFRELRNIGKNLGLNSWRNTNLQILYFALGILFYLLGIIVY